MPSVYGLIRVSTSHQEIGPEAQRAAITAWASSQGLSVTAWHEDIGVSGGAPLEKRPGLLAALEAIGAGDYLVVAKRDRLARDVVLTAMVERLVERAGATLVSADGTGNGTGPEAQLMRHIMSCFASYERAIIGGRIRAALAIKREKGEHLGPIPYGYRIEGGMLVAHPEEERVVKLIFRMASEGWSYREIGVALETQGVATRRGGKRWAPATLHDILHRE